MKMNYALKALMLTLVLNAGYGTLTRAAFADEVPEHLSKIKADLEKLGSNSVIKIFTQPTKYTTASVTYTFGSEIPLNPGQIILADVPEELRNRPISQVAMWHRQDESLGELERDPDPALLSMLVHGLDSKWRFWAGHHSGKWGAKFAEPRSNPEYDVLFDWPEQGTKEVLPDGGEGYRSHALVKSDAMELINVGVDQDLVSGLYYEVIPPKSDEYITYTFSPGSTFGDPETVIGRSYGGGEQYRGHYPNAPYLGESGEYREAKSLEGLKLKFEGNQVSVPIPAGKKFSVIDVMCGDTHPDEKPNKDKHIGSIGNAKLTIKLVKADGTETVLRNRVNVGPQGVGSAFPEVAEVAKAGDRVVIENPKRDSLYIMAVRLGVNQ